MCGRYSLTTPIEALRRIFSFDSKSNLAPRYNIAPSQPVEDLTEENGVREMQLMQWGLVPSWAKDPVIGYKMINARAETAHEKPSYRHAWKRRRCLILADGFYEWRSEHGAKQPYRIAFNDNRPFAFAGLYEHWSGPDGSELTTCSILTTQASDFLKPVHHRMPVILEEGRHAAWLDPLAEFESDILPPFEDPDLIYFPVSKEVNKPANDHAGLIVEVELETAPPPKVDVQGSLF